MPGEVIDRPNPSALPSQLPDEVLDLAAKIQRKPLDKDVAQSLEDFQNAACYIAAAMIFLKDNALLESDLTFDHVKPRLLGKVLPPFSLKWY